MASPTPRPGDPLTPVGSGPVGSGPVGSGPDDSGPDDSGPDYSGPDSSGPDSAAPAERVSNSTTPADLAPNGTAPIDRAGDPLHPAGDPLHPAADPLRRAADPLREAAETMRAVRERCVWSQRITHDDLVPYLVEESAELIDAVETGTRADLREELGDLLWQVLFHSAVAADDPDDPFDIDDVAAGLTDKMVRRHPHVFADAVAATPDEVLVHWNAAKAAEKRERRSVLDGVSPHMPPLALAQKLLSRAPTEVPVPAPGGAPQTEAELGGTLLALVAVAQERGWDAERALRGAIRTLEADIRSVESRLAPVDLEE